MSAPSPVHRLRWAGLVSSMELDVILELGHRMELQSFSLEDADALAPDAAGAEDVETPAAGELRRSIQRCTRGARNRADVEACLGRLLAMWRASRARGARPLIIRSELAVPPYTGGVRLGARVAERPGPRLFLDRFGSANAELSWVPLGGVGDDAEGYEVDVRGYVGGRGAVDSEPNLESLGSTIAPGGASARSIMLRRLRPLRWHRVRVRAFGPERSWQSCWSNEASFKTLSEEAARAAGYTSTTSEHIFAPSERQISSSVCAPDAGMSDSELLPTADEIARHRADLFADDLRDAFGPARSRVVTKDLLDARSCKAGWQSFVRSGTRYSRPPSEREKRMQRMRLVLAAQELYNPTYAEGNEWAMGPFYYEDVGMACLEKVVSNAGG